MATDTETEEAETDGGLEGCGFGRLIALPESRDVKMLAGLWAAAVLVPVVISAVDDGEAAVAVALVTDGADGRARLIEPAMKGIGAAECDIAGVFDLRPKISELSGARGRTANHQPDMMCISAR